MSLIPEAKKVDMINSRQDVKGILEECKSMILIPKYAKHIKSLYIGGSFKEEDRTEESDLDLIGIVYEDFEPVYERYINQDLQKIIPLMKCKLRVLYLSELQGDHQKGFITKLLPIKLFIRRIPQFPLIWGTPLSVDETIGPYSLKEEIHVQSLLIESYIERLNASENKIPFEWIPKAVLYLSAVEAVIVKNCDFTTSFSEIENNWKRETDHISHHSMRIRKAKYGISEEEKHEYIKFVRGYLEELAEGL
jgi:hypothetical protein